MELSVLVLTVVWPPCVRWSARRVGRAHSRTHGTVGCQQVAEGLGTARGAGARHGTAVAEVTSPPRRGGREEPLGPPGGRVAASCWASES